jgi:hypothetical protein
VAHRRLGVRPHRAAVAGVLAVARCRSVPTTACIPASRIPSSHGTVMVCVVVVEEDGYGSGSGFLRGCVNLSIPLSSATAAEGGGDEEEEDDEADYSHGTECACDGAGVLEEAVGLGRRVVVDESGVTRRRTDRRRGTECERD